MNQVSNRKTFRSKINSRRFRWGVFAVGLCLIFVLNLCQPATLEVFRMWFSSKGAPPEYANKMDDFSRTDRLFQGLDEESLDSVKDNAPVKAKETQTAMKIWNQLHSMELTAIRNQCLGRVLFAQYFKQPETYRGNLLRIKGTIRLAVSKKIPTVLQKGTEAAKKETDDPNYGYDFDHFYELWIQPDDNLHDPVLVNTLEVPEDLPIDREIQVPVVIDGVFFKLYLYESSTGEMLSTPMFYAKAPDWTRPVPETSQTASGTDGTKAPMSSRLFLTIILSGAFLCTGIILYVIYLNTRPDAPAEELPDEIDLK